MGLMIGEATTEGETCASTQYPEVVVGGSPTGVRRFTIGVTSGSPTGVATATMAQEANVC